MPLTLPRPFGLICLALRGCTNWMTPGSPSLDGFPRPKHTYGRGSDFFTPESWIIIKWKLTLWPWPWEHHLFLTSLSCPDSAKQAVRTRSPGSTAEASRWNERVEVIHFQSLQTEGSWNPNHFSNTLLYSHKNSFHTFSILVASFLLTLSVGLPSSSLYRSFQV